MYIAAVIEVVGCLFFFDALQNQGKRVFTKNYCGGKSRANNGRPCADLRGAARERAA